MQNIRRAVFFMLFLGAIISVSQAEVRLPALVGDNMVLQQGGPVNIWGWADPGEEVKVSITGGESAKTVADKDGNWKLKINPPPAGGPYQIEIAGKNTITIKNVLVGEVWLCSGQSNMAWLVSRLQDAKEVIAQANYPQIRLCIVTIAAKPEPQKDCQAKWSECTPDSVPDFSAVGYFFGRQLHQQLQVPIGMIKAACGSTLAECWINPSLLKKEPQYAAIFERQKRQAADYPQLLKEYEQKTEKWQRAADKAKAEGKEPPAEPRPPRGPEHPVVLPGGLYNGMIAPILNYTIKGVIWYQGEANAKRAYQYRRLFPALIENWRQEWGEGDFPFLFVQLAPFGKREAITWAELREAQFLTLRTVPNTGMAVTMDIGDLENIHPANKLDVGKRLSLWALAKTYGRDLVCSGPLYKSMKVEGNKIRLSFDYVGGGLFAKGGPLTNFTIAGEDKQFVEAQAEIEGDTIVVHSDKVPNPIAVRYCWSNDTVGNLFNKEGLPASPFRTDDWPGVTADRN